MRHKSMKMMVWLLLCTMCCVSCGYKGALQWPESPTHQPPASSEQQL